MDSVKTIEKEEFRKMQLLQLDMLVELDKVCRENNINYVIFCGTQLGAIRNKGYIPWDDDADIAMLREDYEKFKEVASQLNQEICFFQDHTTDPFYRWGYGKLRRTGTRFVRVGQKHIKCKTGVCIDVFPLDDVPKSWFGQVIQDFKCFCLRKITWSEVARVHSRGIVKLWWTLLSKISIKRVYKSLGHYTKKSSNNSTKLVRILMFKSLGKLYRKAPIKYRYGFPKKYILEKSEYEFEGHVFWGTKDYDEFLSLIYGNYMELPPEDKREPHAPVSDYSF